VIWEFWFTWWTTIPSVRDGVAGLIPSIGLVTKTFACAEEFPAAPRPKMASSLDLDVNLTGMSGLDVQQQLLRAGQQVPVIFLTGYGDIPTTVRAVRAGAVDFLTKPVDDEVLLIAIRLRAGTRRYIQVKGVGGVNMAVGAL